MEHSEFLCRDLPTSQLNNDPQQVLRQSGQKFRRLMKDDTVLKDFVRDNIDMVDACAVGSIMLA